VFGFFFFFLCFSVVVYGCGGCCLGWCWGFLVWLGGSWVLFFFWGGFPLSTIPLLCQGRLIRTYDRMRNRAEIVGKTNNLSGEYNRTPSGIPEILLCVSGGCSSPFDLCSSASRFSFGSGADRQLCFMPFPLFWVLKHFQDSLFHSPPNHGSSFPSDPCGFVTTQGS